MVKKRNCRKSSLEKLLHQRAVKVRKMTDKQLCQHIEDIKSNAYEDGYKDGKKQGYKTSNVVEKFLQRLECMCGTGNGIGKSTVNKLRIFAKKEGYLS